MSESGAPLTGAAISYLAPPAGRAPARELVAVSGPCQGGRFPFFDYLEIGRLEPGQAPAPGVLRVADGTVSERHCVITQDTRGRCWVRDTSSNGTRIDHRRLVPGTESELQPGQVLTLGLDLAFRLGAPATKTAPPPEAHERRTKLVSSWTSATVVVGDIRGYTTLVREAQQESLEASVSGLFHQLTRRVTELGGTVKEYSGDAILAYWEAGEAGNHAVRACRAALALDGEAARLGRDPALWRLAQPARMEWALASGNVLVNSMGGPHPVGLSMIGPPVVLAYRLEKLADDDTGRILACGRTRALAAAAFRFRALGPRMLDGFAEPQDVFALTGAS